MNRIPNPVRAYPALPPVGRCPCASCSRNRGLCIQTAVEMAAAAAEAWGDYVASLADRSGGSAVSTHRAWRAVVRIPAVVSRAAKRVRERHKTAAERWAEMQP